MNTTQLKEHIEQQKKAAEYAKTFVKFKYEIGDMIEGEVNVFYITERYVAERVEDVEHEIIPGVWSRGGKDWVYVAEYIVENVTQNKKYKYGEKQLDNLIESGCTLHRRVANENKNRI